MRLFGRNIPDEKKIAIALTSVYGIGHTLAGKILKKAEIDPNRRTKELSQAELNRIKQAVEQEYTVEGELRQSIRQDINRLKNIKSYRGIRHVKKLPARGQNTKRNSRTVRGNVRRTMGSGRRKLTLK
ncbi:MAG: 30S ribosomal protein S13 [Candidatus Colwellbacteria bacterium CG10_big_fil_rev_8_21_14_0_10_42_22]|uniref:Small ribosomal subunit protein uS13 n=1 Tax=Candidatus Colwellbacteria bacterium CG10_big_fil_rev_8_21_14_0_10_42_22 TaxID=1974540 RepID=A0A2H0VFI2_9BACT|nr:MAG: 30S ribosomal protein S13 [Candidatus Colwellbacteria bacterium CG10_big_fil_rev_8_21_14_0_10_42_22]